MREGERAVELSVGEFSAAFDAYFERNESNERLLARIDEQRQALRRLGDRQEQAIAARDAQEHTIGTLAAEGEQVEARQRELGAQLKVESAARKELAAECSECEDAAQKARQREREELYAAEVVCERARADEARAAAGETSCVNTVLY